MSDSANHISSRELRTPRAAAIAGIIFAALYSASYILILRAVPAFSVDSGAWLASRSGNVYFAVSLLPFAGIAFLWFMAVVRDGLGHLEDQFFSTLFFGSGLLYLAMTFLAASIGGALLSLNAIDPGHVVDEGMFALTRAIGHKITTVYAIRMAGMFMIVLGTIWLRTALMPRWLVIVTYVLAFVLLISIAWSQWIMMVFPLWVLLVSVVMLYREYGSGGLAGKAVSSGRGG